MAEKDITLEDILEESVESLEDFSENAEETFFALGKGLGNKLNAVIGADVVQFNNDLSGVLATAGLDILSPRINKAASSIFGNNEFGSFAGNAANNFISGAVNNGLNRFFRGKTRMSSRETQRSVDAASQMRFSREQQATALLRELERAKRNL